MKKRFPKEARTQKENLNFSEVLEKMRHFCAYQERSERQVLQKMCRLQLDETQKKQVLDYLIQENFLNHQRFQESFVSGKSRMLGWGPEKIKHKLYGELGKPVDFTLEKEDFEIALNKLAKILTRKKEAFLKINDLNWAAKLFRFGCSRGFDPEDVNKIIQNLP
jgi:regulatory protein